MGIEISRETKDAIMITLGELNAAVGTPLVDDAHRKLAKILPPGLHTSYGLGTKTFCIVDYWGARVL